MKLTHNIVLLNLATTDEETAPRRNVSSAAQLKSLLIDLSAGRSIVVDLLSSNGPRLQIGIGGKFASAHFVNPDSMPPYFSAKTREILAKGDVEFLLGGTPTATAPELCLSVQEILQIAEYFLSTEDRDPSFEWVEC